MERVITEGKRPGPFSITSSQWIEVDSACRIQVTGCKDGKFRVLVLPRQPVVTVGCDLQNSSPPG